MFSFKQNKNSKQQSFMSQVTSVRTDTETSSMISMFSPRNIIKYISTTINDYNTRPKIYKSNPAEQEQFLETFSGYWSKIQSEFKNYRKNKVLKATQKQKQNRNDHIQLKIKFLRIPKLYFNEQFDIFFTEKFNKLSLIRKQEEVTEYLDTIQILLWNKTSKNSEKYFQCIENFNQTIKSVEGQLERVRCQRENHHQKLIQFSKIQLKIKQTYEKRQRIQQLLCYLELMKKLKSIKDEPGQQLLSRSEQKPAVHQKLQILQTIKKKQLQIGSKLTSLSNIVPNLQLYRQQIKSNIYQHFSKEMIQLMNQLLDYDKNQWENIKISPQMLGKQLSTENLLQQSRLNITILDQSCFQSNDFPHKSAYSENSQKEQHSQKKNNRNSGIINNIVQKLKNIWQAILRFDLYDEDQINQLIMRQLVRHNVKWNKDIEEYLSKLFQKFQSNQEKKVQNINPLLEADLQNQFDSQQPKQIFTTLQTSQKAQNNLFSTPKKINYFSSIPQIPGISGLKDFNQLKKKTFDTFKRFGNVSKIRQTTTKSWDSSVLLQTGSYCRLKEIEISDKKQKAKTKSQQNIVRIETNFFLKVVKLYYSTLSSLVKFFSQNSELLFFKNFIDKLSSFIEQRVKFFYSVRHINEKTSVSDFLLYLNLIDYWCDVSEEVYENLSSLKWSVTEEYLTQLQKNTLINELKNAIQESTYLPHSISSTHINTFYYVFFWDSFQRLKQTQNINMSLTILKDQINKPNRQEDNFRISDFKGFQNELKIIDKKIVYRREKYLICESFIVLLKDLERYLQLKEVLDGFKSNIEEKICEVVGFYVWYNLKNINKTGSNNKPRTLRNLCVLHSTISFLKIVFTEQLNINNKKFIKTLDQFGSFFKSLDSNITMTPYLLVQEQISNIYQNNTLSSQSQIPCKQTTKILDIVKLALEQLKTHFVKQKIIKVFQPTIKLIMKNYFGYLTSLGKRGLVEVKEFLPKFKQLLLDYGIKNDDANDKHEPPTQTHLFMKQLKQMQKNFKSKVSQLK